MLSPQSPGSSDSNLLFAVLALQRGFLDQNRFVDACAAWAARRDTPIPALLLDRQWITAADQAQLDADIERLLKKHAGDVRASIHEVAADNDVVRQSLGQVFLDASWENLRASDVLDSSDLKGPKPRQRYKLVGDPKNGGIGRVWRARDTQLGREVALKELRSDRVLSPELRDRFLAEAQITAQLTHPNIVPAFDLVKHDGMEGPFYTMQFVEGQTLSDAVAAFHDRRKQGKAGNLELRQLLTSFVAVCKAVDYAHDRGVIHRDLKGLNIIVGKHGEVFVLDWGMAKIVSDTAASAYTAPVVLATMAAETETQPGAKVGTPAYMAPEQAAGKTEEIDRRTDVYALGVILYEILTGRLPHQVEDTPSLFLDLPAGDDRPGELYRRKLNRLIRQIISEPPPRPRTFDRSVSSPLEKVCLKALAKNKTQRYSTAGDVARDVERWLGDEAVSVAADALAVRMRRWMRKHSRSASAISAAVLVALIGATIGMFWYQRELDRRANAAALSEQLLSEAQRRREDLHATLREKGGVFHLLNDPANRWRPHITAGHDALKNAQEWLANAGDVEPRLSLEMAVMQDSLLQDDADYTLAINLDKIRVYPLAAITGGVAPYRQAAQEYARVFAEARIPILKEHPEGISKRLCESAIREALIAAIDDWARIAFALEQYSVADRLLSVGRLAAPDPTWADDLRQLRVWRDRNKLVSLVEAAPKESLSPSLWASVGWLLRHWDPARQLGWLREAQARYPADFCLNYELGNALLRDPPSPNNAVQATAFFRVAVAVRPQSAVAYTSLGIALHKQKLLAEASAAYRKAIRLDAGDPTPYYNLGIALYKQHQFTEAISAYRKAIDLSPNDNWAYHNLGLALQATNQISEAIRTYNKAIQIDSGYALVYHSLARLYYEQKLHSEAITTWRRLLEHHPKDSIARAAGAGAV